MNLQVKLNQYFQENNVSAIFISDVFMNWLGKILVWTPTTSMYDMLPYHDVGTLDI